MILTTLPGQFQDVHSPDKLSDHDIVSGTLKTFIPPIKKPRRKVYRYQKGDYESMKKDTLEFAKEKYFNGNTIEWQKKKQHDLYVNNLVGDVNQTPETSICTSIVRKKTPKVFHP